MEMWRLDESNASLNEITMPHLIQMSFVTSPPPRLPDWKLGVRSLTSCETHWNFDFATIGLKRFLIEPGRSEVSYCERNKKKQSHSIGKT